MSKIQKNKVYKQDCIEYLNALSKQDRVIDTIILDPPYYKVVNEKWDNQWKSMNDYLEWMNNVLFNLSKVSKDNCSFWLFGFPYQLSYIIPLVEKYGFTYRQHITVYKGMRSVAGRTSNKLKMFPTATEYIIYFYKSMDCFLGIYCSFIFIDYSSESIYCGNPFFFFKIISSDIHFF